MRTIIDVPEQALKSLDRLCKREGISRAEAIRRAVRLFLGQQLPPDDGDIFGLWREREIQGRDYEDRLRDEWSGREPDS
jgi:hypothetical protein